MILIKLINDKKFQIRFFFLTLYLQINQNARIINTICHKCFHQINEFHEFYQKINENNKYILENSNIEQRIVIVKSQLIDDAAQQYDVIEIPCTNAENNEIIETNLTSQIIFENNEQYDSHIVELTEEIDDEIDELNDDKDHDNVESIEFIETINEEKLNKFPREIIKDSKLLIHGKELIQLISKFYRLECDACLNEK